MFLIYETVEDELLYMNNSAISKFEGWEKVILKMILGKELSLTDVLNVPDVQKNLVFKFVLSKKGSILVFEFNKFVLTKNGMYVGEGYITNGLLRWM